MSRIIGPFFRLAALALLLALVLRPEWFEPILKPFTENNAPVIYNQGSLLSLTLYHLGLVAVASLIGAALALVMGVFVTRKVGEEFLPLSRSLVNIGQTFPPVAVLALAVPVVGFGLKPTLIALVLYGLLPIFENTITGLKEVPANVVEAARGMGLNPTQQLFRVELPLALPVILAGIRLSVVINMGTATIGSTVAAKGLGEVIIAGRVTSHTAVRRQGGIIDALLAVLISDALSIIERRVARRTGRLAEVAG